MKPSARKWVKRLSLLAAIVCVLAYIAYWQILPGVVSTVLRAKLQQLGIVDVKFRVAHVSFDRLDIVAVRSSGLNVGQISVQYSVFRLLKSRLDAVYISGAEVALDLAGKHDSDKPLVTVDASSSDKQRPEASGPQPFGYLHLAACDLLVTLPGKQLHIPFEGTSREVGGAAGSDLDLTLYLLDTPLHVSGQINLLANTATLKAQVDQLDASTLLLMTPDSLQLHGGGHFAATVDYTRSATGQTISATVARSDAWIAQKLGWHLLTLDGIVLRADGWLDAHNVLTRASANATTQIRFDADTSAEMRFSGERLPSGEVDAAVALHSPHWQTAVKDIHVVGLATADTKVSATWQTSGVLPPLVVNLLGKSGIDASDLGRISLQGPVRGELGSRDGKTDWSADAPALHLQMERGDVRVPLTGVTLGGVTCSGDMALHGDPRQVTATLAPWTNLAARSIVHPKAGTIVANDPKLDAADVTLTGDPVTFNFSPATGAWSAAAPGVRLRLAATNVGLDSEGNGWRGVGGSIICSAIAQPGKTTVLLDSDAWLAIDASHVRVGSNDVDVKPLGLLMVGATGRQPPGVTLDEYGINGSLALVTPKGRSAAFGATMAAMQINDLRLDLSGGSGGGQQPHLLANLAFDHSSLQIPSAGVALNDMSASVPVSQGLHAPPAGRFDVKSVKVGPDAWPGLTGSLGLADGIASLQFHWPIRPELQLETQATADLLNKDGIKADLHTWLPKGTITDKGAIASLISATGDVELTGTFAANATVHLERGQLTPKIELGVEHVNVSSKKFAADLQDITTGVTFNRLSPLTTPGNQQLKVARAVIGKLDLSGGLTSFRVEDLHSVLIEQTTWNWAGGQLYTNAFRFDPSAPNVNLTVYGDTLGVDPLLKLFAGPDSRGSGSVYGRLPVQVRWPSLNFGDGFLYATPGPGSVLLGKEAAASVGSALSQNDALKAGAGSNSAMVKSRIVDALKNFHYDLLKLDFQNRSDDLLASLKLDGYGQIGSDKQELHLGVNAAGFDKLLSDFLVIKKALGK